MDAAGRSEAADQAAAMDLFERTTHSFIVRIWLERVVEGGEELAWRGHITHVPGGERIAFSRMGELNAFVLSFLGRQAGSGKLGPRRPRGYRGRR
jgi:hypothetical protein